MNNTKDLVELITKELNPTGNTKYPGIINVKRIRDIQIEDFQYSPDGSYPPKKVSGNYIVKTELVNGFYDIPINVIHTTLGNKVVLTTTFIEISILEAFQFADRYKKVFSEIMKDARLTEEWKRIYSALQRKYNKDGILNYPITQEWNDDLYTSMEKCEGMNEILEKRCPVARFIKFYLFAGVETCDNYIIEDNEKEMLLVGAGMVSGMKCQNVVGDGSDDFNAIMKTRDNTSFRKFMEEKFA